MQERPDPGMSRRLFSCYDILEPEWLNCARESQDDRIYVHEEILEWIVGKIDNNLLNWDLKADIKEVFHHNLDGPVYLIKFYRALNEYDEDMPINSGSWKYITDIKHQLKYKMPWKSIPTYFLRIDCDIENRKIHILKKLQELNLLHCFKVTTFYVNWLYIPKIEIYQFSLPWEDDRLEIIDDIFHEVSKPLMPLYICDQFKWHQVCDSYVDVDTLAMDICTEEWRRHELLKDFTIENILHLDLANKDYRDRYFNEYLDRYLNILLKRILPQLFSDQNDKLELPIAELKSYIGQYIVSRFYNKIGICCFDFDDYLLSDPHIVLYGLQIIKKNRNDSVHLKGNSPSPDSLLKMKSQSILYVISNYIPFSDTLFRALLNISNDIQQYAFRFDDGFNFEWRSGPQSSLHLTSYYIWPTVKKQIEIKLYNCTDENIAKLVKFVEYLFNLFNNSKKINVNISICFINCELEDYSFLKDIGNGIDDIQFEQMNILHKQLKILSCSLIHQKSVTFRDCNKITDTNVMVLLENLDFDRLYIKGVHACTPLLFYMLADHLINKEGVQNIDASRFNCNYLVKYDFDLIEFSKVGNQIIARHRYSKEPVDIYCLMNGIDDNESIDLSNKMFME